MKKRKIICILIFVLLITTTLSVSGNNKHSEQSSESAVHGTWKNNYNSPSTYVLVRIDTTDGLVTIPRDAEVIGSNPGKWIDIIIPQSRLFELTDDNIYYSVLVWDVESYSDNIRGEYHTLAEMENILSNIASNYTNITSLYSIGTTYEGRDIWCLEITDNPGVDEGEPGVFYMGLHHAREWPTVEICLNIASELTSNYGSDPNITDVVDNCRLWLVTCVNPDGYHYDHDLGNDWRKNRHYFPEFGTYGVDLNRNYGGTSNGNIWGAWGSIGTGSVTHKPSGSLYCGPGPLSELETQAIRDIFLQNDICASISWHTHGELVLWPWGYSSSDHTPDDTYMSQVGQQIASRITKQSGSGIYLPQQSAGLYPTTGDTTDWAYGYGHYVQGRPTFTYTIEACSSFHPSSSYLDQICDENFDGALYLLQEAENISNVIPRVMPPEINETPDDPDGDYTVSWNEKNPDANPDYFQLDELTGLSLVTDDVESGSGLWTIDGFTISTSESHSSSHSYKSRYSNGDCSSMTSIYTVPVAEGMNLSFWCWYDIEDNYDMAFVEVSREGRAYDLLDKFTGSSSGWVYKEYDLSDYVDESVFIRFRYTTDGNTLDDGFYVDDVSPVANFTFVNTLSNSITDNFYNILGNPNGTYYYQLRGYNSGHGWGDFSTLEKIQVGQNASPVHVTNFSDNWNFVSLPFNQSIDLADLIVNYGGVNYTWADATSIPIVDPNVYGWDRSLDMYVPATTMEPGYGYWIYAYFDCELWAQCSGITHDNHVTNLEISWNSFGTPSDQPVNLSDLIIHYDGVDYNWTEATSIPIVDPNVYGWDRTLHMYFQASDSLEPGYAYWIYAYQDCNLINPNI